MEQNKIKGREILLANGKRVQITDEEFGRVVEYFALLRSIERRVRSEEEVRASQASAVKGE